MVQLQKEQISEEDKEEQVKNNKSSCVIVDLLIPTKKP